jgi:hypothetical protein
MCCAIYEKHVSPIASTMSDILGNTLKNVYAALHKHYSGGNANETEEDQILDGLYQQRNLRHGTFLRGDQFRTIFGKSKGTIPDEIVLVAVMLTLALALAPKEFLPVKT